MASALYVGKEWKALALYSSYPDIYIAAPDGMRHAAHITYAVGKRSRGIDLFLYEGDPVRANKIVKVLRQGQLSHKEGFEEKLADIESTNSIHYEFVEGLGSIEDSLRELVRLDIALYCKSKARYPSPVQLTHSGRIIPHTTLVKKIPERYIWFDKQDSAKGCLIEANLDLAEGCITQFFPDSSMDSSFGDDEFIGFFHDSRSACAYCRDAGKYKPFPKSVIEIEQSELEHELANGVIDGHVTGRPVHALRLGKKAEAGSVYTRDELILTLESCIRTHTRVIMPTKFLEYDPLVSLLLKKSDSSLLYSMGYPSEEPGLARHGIDDKFLLEQAVRYKEHGVSSNLYILIDATSPPAQRELGMLDFAARHQLGVQLLPIRIGNKLLAPRVTGASWRELLQDKDQLALFNANDDAGRYHLTGNTILTPAKIHPAWMAMAAGKQLALDPDYVPDIRICHHTSQLTYCGTCFLCDKGFKLLTEEGDMRHPKAKRKVAKDRDQFKISFKKTAQKD